ncbi:MAG: PSD1 and planctomycete cytochrome C domain-containing protein [Planctomycetia bacterium]|nr:PSD1 and planctomycete cytochrome C domain-containing protein [Planctomycetia bacterium]
MEHSRAAAVVVWAVVAAACGRATAAAPDFVADIRPLFERHCHACHSGEHAKSGLRLDLKAAAFHGGDGWGAAIVPGEPDSSPLVRAVQGKDDLQMPPADSAVPPLAEAEIARLVEWVKAGAVWPDGVDTVVVVDKTDHWAFQPVRRSPVPAVRAADWPRNDVDRFVLARLEAEGLAPSAAADRRVWIRRVFFDLTGLPPTPEEVERFVNDRSADPHGRIIEELLASPRYGERFAQHWLDVVRYADTHGYEVNTERPTAWPYRDYVIAAFNDDVPYDRFVREQIAGAEPGKEASTGFLVTAAVLLPGQIGQDEASKRAARQDALNDIIVNTSETVLGLTVGCARCHDHKFDPVTARDYYSLQAFFAGVGYGERTLATPAAVRMRKQFEAAQMRLAELEPLVGSGTPRAAVTPSLNTDRIAPVRAKRLRFTILDTNGGFEPCIDELQVFDVEGHNVALASAGAKASASGSLISAGVHELDHVNDGEYGNSRSWIASTRQGAWVTIEFDEPAMIERICWARDRTEEYKDRMPTAYRIEVSAAAGDDAPWTLVADATDREAFNAKPGDEAAAELSPAERQAREAAELEKKRLREELQAAIRGTRVFAGSFRKPHPVHLLTRGDAEQRGEELPPRSIAAFAGLVEPVALPADAPERERRAALAAWLTDPRHPLPARVMANRIWQWHFGTGLVDSANDFGRNGSRPTHPVLLDWLADEFVSSGWSIKHLHRLIVSSATYGQSGAANTAGLGADAESRLLWRFPPRRLEAETIRDTMLAVSGRLNPEMGGRGFSLFNSRGGLSGFLPIESFDASGRRRMIYAHKVRMELDDVFGAFDCPDAGQSQPRRRQSTTPIQALNLFNSPFTIEESREFAARVEADVAAISAANPPADSPGRRRIDRAFELAFSRPPDAVEAAAAEAVVREHGLAALCRVIFNSNEFLFIP